MKSLPYVQEVNVHTELVDSINRNINSVSLIFNNNNLCASLHFICTHQQHGASYGIFATFHHTHYEACRSHRIVHPTSVHQRQRGERHRFGIDCKRNPRGHTLLPARNRLRHRIGHNLAPSGVRIRRNSYYRNNNMRRCSAILRPTSIFVLTMTTCSDKQLSH